MIFSYDKTGFPLVTFYRSTLEIQLLPVTKVQFEQFLADTNDFSANQYQQILACNPVIDLSTFTNENRENLFITGILPEEIHSFAKWMGHEYDVLTVEEWREIYSDFSRKNYTLEQIKEIPSECESESAKIIFQRLIELLNPYSMFDLSFMEKGVVEWVRDGRNHVGLGTPRQKFQPNLFNPLYDVVKPVDITERIRYFGFRLVKRLL